MIVEIVFAYNRTEHIEVRDGDDPSQLARQFHDRHLADEVAVDIGEGVLQGIANAGLGRQMQDPIDRWESRGETGDGVAVGDVNRQKGEPGGRLQTRQPCLLKRGIVIVVKAIDANHLLAAGKQGVGGMHALPRRILAACGDGAVRVQRGVRVAGMERADAAAGGSEKRASWRLLGVAGSAAFHDTAESAARGAARTVLGEFDAVVVRFGRS